MATLRLRIGLAGALGLALALFAGCEKLGNPFGPDTDLGLGTGAGNLPVVNTVAPGPAAELVDDDTSVAGIQATLVVTFSDYMDPASFPAGVTVVNTSTGVAVADLDIRYNADARRLYVRHLDWTGASAFLLKLASGTVRNRWGTALDGNWNGTAEGDPYDEFVNTFYTSGSAPESCVGIRAPRMSPLQPDTALTRDTLPQLAARFSAPMDTTRLVAANFLLTSASGASVPLTRVAMTPQEVVFVPVSPLRYGDMYYIDVVHANLKADARVNTPEHLLALDTDSDGPEAQEPAVHSYFLCDTVQPPTVRVEPVAQGRRFEFSRLMDQATLATANVRVFDADGFVPGTFVFSLSNQGSSTVLDYFFSRPVRGSLRCFVSRTVESTKERMLDGQDSPNGIGGEPWDDYWSD